MFELILKCFEDVGQDTWIILSTDDLKSWPQQEVSALKRLGLLKKAAPAKTVECPGCEDACLMPVHVFPAQDDRLPRIFIACDKREDTGRILIETAALEQWQIDIPRFSSLLASALGTVYTPDEIIPQQAFYLGALTINRKRRSVFFVVNRESLYNTFESGKVGQYPTAFFLVASGQSGVQEVKQGVLIPLFHILLPLEDALKVDFGELEDLLSSKSLARQDVLPLAVPIGTEWNHVFISFVNEHTVQIKVAGNVENRSFDELGFSDLRAGAQESRPSELWGVFRQLAIMNGEINFEESNRKFKDPMKMKKWISEIRKKLRSIFPDIPGDPFHPYKKVNGYKTHFTLNTIPSFM